MSEEKEESVMSVTKKAIIGAITTAVTAGGAWFATHLGGGDEPKEEAKTEQAAPGSATAPVVINVQQNQENKQQVKQGSSSPTVIRERVIEKPAAPAAKPEPKEEDPW